MVSDEEHGRAEGVMVSCHPDEMVASDAEHGFVVCEEETGAPVRVERGISVLVVEIEACRGDKAEHDAPALVMGLPRAPGPEEPIEVIVRRGLHAGEAARHLCQPVTEVTTVDVSHFDTCECRVSGMEGIDSDRKAAF